MDHKGTAPLLCVVCQKWGVWHENEVCRNCNELAFYGRLNPEGQKRLTVELQRRRDSW